jgi:thiol-disulfide isomerase/thioredoxin
MRQTGALLVLVVFGLSMLHAGDDGVTGNWKLTIMDDGQPATLWLLKLDLKGGKLSGDIEGLRRVPASVLSDLKIEGDRLYFTIGLRDKKGLALKFEGVLPKAGAKKILGSMPWGEDSAITPVVLEQTQAKNALDVEKETLSKSPNDPRVFLAVQELIFRAPGMKVPAKDVQEWVDVALKLAEKHGPRLLQDTAIRYSDQLLEKGEYAKVAVETLKRVEKNLTAGASAEDKLRILAMLATALKKAGEKDSLPALQKRIDMLETVAHEENEKRIMKFKPAKFAGRKVKSDRAVLVELFTGAYCPPCVAADVAFDALGKAFTRSEVVLLQYHVHIPLPDALTNADSEARQAYYRIRSAPTIFFAGQAGPQGGGGLPAAEEKFKEYREEVEPLLEKPATVNLNASVARMKDKLMVKVQANGLAKPGDKVRLRVALVEDWARYRGGNGITYHHNIVRALIGGAQGTSLPKKDNDVTLPEFDIAALRKDLAKYLDDFEKTEGKFHDDQRPLALRNLKIVAFVQNDETREVLQAVEVAVKAE